MKLSAKPISSPGRVEKFPPPLMRFLRSNVGSKSRGRSRSSPLFFRKKNTAIETQEPSSPKVTCMGQVRVRRSKKSHKTPARPHRNGAPMRRRFKRIRNALCCRHIGWKLKAKAFRPSWRKWVFSFHWCSLRKPKIREDSSRIESNLGSKIEASVRKTEEETDEDYEEESKVFASSPSSPPKNALLLTRCRSAPYRSSSLAVRFWGSPLSTEETEPEPEPEETTRTEPENRESDNPTLERESISRDSDQESETDPETEEKQGFLNQFEEKIANSANSEEPKAEQLSTIRPLILTRCKTVPARTAAKLDPDLTFWKKRSIGFM
ncbi:hypothetical protein SLEP1_g23432 [Rubroshorea leprosula]|uniref:Protamine P1 family protein n=1 Tax=Rubroshorea leprosula TaxID=152421 RepID=A0AAV5JHL2_9ROSI|nr:hypothetical protein SLEP1_g23432 [Rubroshorea leprosula]